MKSHVKDRSEPFANIPRTVTTFIQPAMLVDPASLCRWAGTSTVFHKSDLINKVIEVILQFHLASASLSEFIAAQLDCLAL